jgi:hypothetical protein
MSMLAAINNFLMVLDAVAHVFSLLLLAMLGAIVLSYIIAATMAQVSKQQDDVEQLALKFSHKK